MHALHYANNELLLRVRLPTENKKLSHIIGAPGSQDLWFRSPIMTPADTRLVLGLARKTSFACISLDRLHNLKLTSV